MLFYKGPDTLGHFIGGGFDVPGNAPGVRSFANKSPPQEGGGFDVSGNALGVRSLASKSQPDPFM